MLLVFLSDLPSVRGSEWLCCTRSSQRSKQIATQRISVCLLISALEASVCARHRMYPSARWPSVLHSSVGAGTASEPKLFAYRAYLCREEEAVDSDFLLLQPRADTGLTGKPLHPLFSCRAGTRKFYVVCSDGFVFF